MASKSLKYHSFGKLDHSDDSKDDSNDENKLRVYYNNFLVALKYVWSDTLKHKKNFFIGFTAVWIIVLSVSYVMNPFNFNCKKFLNKI